MTRNKFISIVNAIALSVAFTINLPELIALINIDDNGFVYQEDIQWQQVVSEMLFTYASIIILFFLNERIFRWYSYTTNVSRKKIAASFMLMLITNSLLGHCYILLHRFCGIPVIESMLHVYSHPLRDIIISSIVVTVGCLIHQVIKSRNIMLENQQLKTENLKNQFEALKNQLNPHMLFNSLNTLYSLIEEDPVKAQGYVSELSKVMRYTLQQEIDRDSSVIPLSEEVEFIYSYIYLLKMRFEDNLSFIMDVDESILNRKIPRMALQLLVENAVKHNEISNKHPLTVRIYSTDEGNLEVVNNRQLRRGVVASTGIGLSNLSKRYNLLFNKQIVIHETDCEFRVVLPL